MAPRSKRSYFGVLVDVSCTVIIRRRDLKVGRNIHLAE